MRPPRPPYKPPPRLLTVPQVAGALGVGETKVWELIRSGRLRSVKIDASRRVPEDAVAEFIKALPSEPRP